MKYEEGINRVLLRGSYERDTGVYKGIGNKRNG